MEIEKHYTSNCEKIVKCGWHFPPCQSNLLPPSIFVFYFVALLPRISHFQGATFDIHKFYCRTSSRLFFFAFNGDGQSAKRQSKLKKRFKRFNGNCNLLRNLNAYELSAPLFFCPTPPCLSIIKNK